MNIEKQKSTYTTIDEYIAACPKELQPRLKELRRVIQAAAPHATEKISYQMPTFYLNGNLVHFAAHKNHIGFYPVPSAILKFEKELAGYARSKGAIQFSHDKPLPLDLIAKMVKFRVEENLQKKKR